MRFIDRGEVERRLTYEVCIPLVREAMIAFSAGQTRQLLRSIIPVAKGVLGLMPGALADDGPFGAKLISVYPGNFDLGRPSHQGVIVLFEPSTGATAAIVDAREVTAIRTAAASAVATDALARADASRLGILGYGEQATTHARAISKVRRLERIGVWGRSAERAADFCRRMQAELGLPFAPYADAQSLAAASDILCTVTLASEPVLKGAWVQPGTHVNLVGSGAAGPVEVDNDLVVRSRFIADSREGVLAQGAEFLRARQAGLIGEDHIVAEIGEVLAGKVPGRRTADEITAYKSLGHVVQDLASAWWLCST
ncbi:MAG TPA: ornithine cyclodeaminase family protein [Caulobacteraceae bacterium]|nr:ornithine cyclodeaminase family protein [Caulobacteraceae bacterium]